MQYCINKVFAKQVYHIANGDASCLLYRRDFMLFYRNLLIIISDFTIIKLVFLEE